MPAVKGQRRSRSSARPAPEQWLEGVSFKFKKTAEKTSPSKKSPKTKTRRQSTLLKRLDIDVQDMSSSPSKSPGRASIRRTRRMSMAALSGSAKKAAATSKIPRSSSEKQMPKAGLKAALPPVAKMVASTTSRSNLPPKGKLASSSKSKSSSSTLNISSSTTSRSSSVVKTTATSSVSKDESWIEKISSPKIFYKQTPPSPKLTGAQKRKSYTSATSVLQIELDSHGQKRDRESSLSPVKSKKARVMTQSAMSTAESVTTSTPANTPSPVKKRGRGRPVSNPNKSKIEKKEKTPQKSVTPAKSKSVTKEKTPQKSITPVKSKPVMRGKTPQKSSSKLKPVTKDKTPQKTITPAKSKPVTRGKTPQKSSSKSVGKLTTPTQSKLTSSSKSSLKSASKIPPKRSSDSSPSVSPLKEQKQSALNLSLSLSGKKTPPNKGSRKSLASTKKTFSKQQSSLPFVQISPLQNFNKSPRNRTSVTILHSAEKKSIRKSPAPAKKSPAPAKKSPVPAKKSPAPAKKSPATAKKSPATAKKSPAPAKKSPAPGKKSPAPAKKSPAPAKKSPAPTKKTPLSPLDKLLQSGVHSSSSGDRARVAVLPVSPGSPILRRGGALTRSARKRPVKKVVIRGSSPALTSDDYRKKTPKSSVATSRITTSKTLLVSVKSTSSSPELTRYMSKSSLAAPSPLKRLVKASRANPFTPKPEAQPSKMIKQNMRNKLTSDMSLFKKVSAAALVDPRVSTVRTPTRTALRGAGFVSGNTPASSPALPPTPTSARKYVSRSALMVATARRKISMHREEELQPSSLGSTPLNSTPLPSSHLYASYSSNGSGTVTPTKHDQFDISETSSTSSTSEADDFTASVQMVEEQDSMSTSEVEKEEAVQSPAAQDQTDSVQGKKNSKKGYCSVM